MRVSALFRYPVKSLQGERLDAAIIGMHGIIGDRHWGIVDLDTGLVLTARREPALLMAGARLVEPPVDDAEICTEVEIELPDGTVTTDDEVLSTWLGRRVELRRAETARHGTYEISLGIDDEDTASWVQWSGPRGSFHDSTRTLLSLIADESMRTWDWRRFRANVVVTGADGDEDRLVGEQVQIGSAAFDVAKQIDRCVMTTRPQPATPESPGLDRDLSVLKTINAERATFLGVGLLVTAAGNVRVGDSVAPVAAREIDNVAT
jgi:uncharacterized protein YcbX